MSFVLLVGATGCAPEPHHYDPEAYLELDAYGNGQLENVDVGIGQTAYPDWEAAEIDSATSTSFPDDYQEPGRIIIEVPRKVEGSYYTHRLPLNYGQHTTVVLLTDFGSKVTTTGVFATGPWRAKVVEFHKRGDQFDLDYIEMARRH